MATIYLAGRFSRRFQLQGYRGDLQRAGHVCTSRWIDLAHEVEADAARCAKVDLEDLDIADTVIAFGDEPRSTRSRGGHWVEFGYALAQGKRMILVGHRENIFGHLPEVEFYAEWPEALRALQPQCRLAA
jgi:nucleoside 2-deoxyribosyltransferase